MSAVMDSPPGEIPQANFFSGNPLDKEREIRDRFGKRGFLSDTVSIHPDDLPARSFQ